ncbi:MAG: helix-turn-helix domain-containing protein [Gemmatimonadales bacterium]|jgi:hypothetical protein|nr:helix-turn-helix domain-containing protein [Gemmatimonadales bacterium]
MSFLTEYWDAAIAFLLPTAAWVVSKVENRRVLHNLEQSDWDLAKVAQERDTWMEEAGVARGQFDLKRDELKVVAKQLENTRKDLQEFRQAEGLDSRLDLHAKRMEAAFDDSPTLPSQTGGEVLAEALCESLGLSLRTVQRLCQRGELPARKVLHPETGRLQWVVDERQLRATPRYRDRPRSGSLLATATGGAPRQAP